MLRLRKVTVLGVALIAATLAACGGGGTTDGGVDSGPIDAGPTDAGVDAGPTDAGPTDAGVDAGPTDAGEDAGVDAGPTDAGEDAGVDAGEDAGEDAGPTDGGVTGQAHVRVMHLSPDAPPVDVYVQGETTPVVTSLAFGQSSEYLDLDPGSYTFEVVTTASSGGTPLLQIAATVDADTYYTAVAYDDVAAIQSTVLVDDNSPPAAGNIRVRAVHVAVGVGPVTGYDLADPANPIPVISDVGFGQAADALELPGGVAYTIGFDINADQTPDVTFAIPAVDAGAIVNFFAVSQGPNIFLVAQFATPPGSTTVRLDPASTGDVAFARVIHLIPDLDPVDVYTAGATGPSFENVAFTETTQYSALIAGTYGFELRPANSDPASTPAIWEITFTAAAGTVYTAAAYGNGAAPESVEFEDDVTPPTAAHFKLRFIHVANGVGPVDVLSIEGQGAPTPLFSNVAYGAASDYTEIPVASPPMLGVDVNADGTPDYRFTLPTIPDGAIVNVWAVAPSTGPELVIQPLYGQSTTITPNPMGP